MSTRLVLVLAVALSALGWPCASAFAAGPTLEGEDLFVQLSGVSIDTACSESGNSTLDFTASGPAFGPFPGTFSVSGTLTLGPQTLPGMRPPSEISEGTVAGPILTLEESFTIISALGTVTGTKTLETTSPAQGTCQEVTNLAVGTLLHGAGSVVEVNGTQHYEATIDSVGGSSTDSGTSVFQLDELDVAGTCPTGPCSEHFGGFDELFTTSDQNASTSGSANGGGQVATSDGLGKVTFAFQAEQDESGRSGGCNLVDHQTDRHIKCETVDSYVQTGSSVQIVGQADDSGVETVYEIDATDNGDPNHGLDTFTIETDTGYSAGGPVRHGNVQVRSG